MEHTQENLDAASILRRYSFGLRLQIAVEDSRSVTFIFLRQASSLRSHGICCQSLAINQPIRSCSDRIRWAGSFVVSSGTCPKNVVGALELGDLCKPGLSGQLIGYFILPPLSEIGCGEEIRYGGIRNTNRSSGLSRSPCDSVPTASFRL